MRGVKLGKTQGYSLNDVYIVAGSHNLDVIEASARTVECSQGANSTHNVHREQTQPTMFTGSKLNPQYRKVFLACICYSRIIQ